MLILVRILPGGCTTCKGALTINGSAVKRNVAYYIIAHISKFVPAGSIRVSSNITGSLQNAAFKTPSGQKILIVLNEGTAASTFKISFNGKSAPVTLPAGRLGLLWWNNIYRQSADGTLISHQNQYALQQIVDETGMLK